MSNPRFGGLKLAADRGADSCTSSVRPSARHGLTCTEQGQNWNIDKVTRMEYWKEDAAREKERAKDKALGCS